MSLGSWLQSFYSVCGLSSVALVLWQSRTWQSEATHSTGGWEAERTQGVDIAAPGTVAFQ